MITMRWAAKMLALYVREADGRFPHAIEERFEVDLVVVDVLGGQPWRQPERILQWCTERFVNGRHPGPPGKRHVHPVHVPAV
jgi:hypothetical protein